MKGSDAYLNNFFEIRTKAGYMSWKILLVSFLERFRKFSEHPLERLAEIGLKEGMTFLDVGCGLGFYSFYASSIVGKKGFVYTIDVNREFVEYVENKAKRKGIENIKTMVANAQKTGLPSGSVDIVFLHLVLHDIKDKSAAIKEFNRVLKNHGKLVIDEEDVMPLDQVGKLAEDSGFALSKRLRKTIQIFEKIKDETNQK
jgi:ubiquinone/menaquinone biosynthesis C-methylase UbiE